MPSPPPQATPDEIRTAVQQLFATNLFGAASFAILVWDHIITFADEVELIWKGKKSLIIWLFFINRYVTPFGFIINLTAYLSPSFTPEVCDRFVRYEGSTIVVAIGITALMMMIRVYALYEGNKLVLAILVAEFLAFVGVNAWLLTGAHAVPHPTGILGCSMVFSDNMSFWPTASAWLPLLYDTTVWVFTAYRTLSLMHNKIASNLIKTFFRDGLMYYSVIFTANLVLTVMLVTTDPGIRNICAQFEQLITVTMMSRITLNLRKQTYTPQHPTFNNVTTTMTFNTAQISHIEFAAMQPPGTPQDDQPALVTDWKTKRSSSVPVSPSTPDYEMSPVRGMV